MTRRQIITAHVIIRCENVSISLATDVGKMISFSAHCAGLDRLRMYSPAAQFADGFPNGVITAFVQVVDLHDAVLLDDGSRVGRRAGALRVGATAPGYGNVTARGGGMAVL